MRYVANNPDNFTKPYIAALVGCMQAFAGFWAEFVNIVVLAQRHNVEHCLQDFIAFELLTNVDNIYCASLPFLPLKNSLNKHLSLNPPYAKSRWVGFKRLPFVLLANGLEKFFAVFWFYFTPFAILVLPYL